MFWWNYIWRSDNYKSANGKQHPPMRMKYPWDNVVLTIEYFIYFSRITAEIVNTIPNKDFNTYFSAKRNILGTLITILPLHKIL